jgi:hypothetical protein
MEKKQTKNKEVKNKTTKKKTTKKKIGWKRRGKSPAGSMFRLSEKEYFLLTRKDKIILLLIEEFLTKICKKKKATFTEIFEFLKEATEKPSYNYYHFKFIIIFLRLTKQIKLYRFNTKFKKNYPRKGHPYEFFFVMVKWVGKKV